MEKFNYRFELPKPTTLNFGSISIKLYIVENDVWLFDNEQLANNYGVTKNTIRRHLQRNKNDILLEGIHWFNK